MKKKLLFILILFVSLTGFKNKEMKMPSSFDFAKELLGVEGSKPVINKKAPDDRNVKGFAGQIVSFYIEFTADPAATCEVYKDDKLYQPSEGVNIQKDRVDVDIRNAKLEDSGKYKIVVKNTFGTVEVVFTVTVYHNPMK